MKTKKELIEGMAADANISKAAAALALDSLMTRVTGSLAAGEAIALQGIGTFKVTQRQARNGRNPKTGEALAVPAHKVVRLVVSSTLKAAVNA